MEINEVRRNRLRMWVEKEFDGRVAALCKYYGLPDSSPSYLSQLLSGNRVFGERSARKLENQCGRPAGWLDVDPSKVEDVEVLKFDRQRCAKLRTDDRELIEAFINLVLDRSDRSSSKRFNEVTTSTASEQVKQASRKPVKKAYSEKDEKPAKRAKAG